MIASTARHAGLIGHPVGHSISPVFQQAAFDHCRLPALYELWDTRSSELASRLHRLRGHEFLGANVTIPHKEAVLPLVDEVAPEARLTGAANTIVNRSGRLAAYNTDVGGFVLALRESLRYDLRGRRIAVLGAGGAARAVVAALSAEGAESVLVLNRSSERAQTLANDLRERLGLTLEAAPLDSEARLRLQGCGLVVNCTSVGLAGSPVAELSPISVDDLPHGAAVVDVVANPLVTPLLAAAAARGHPALGGLAMLVHQGALAFQLWTGREAPVAVMMAAAREAMAAGGDRAVAREQA